jgi:hypothetical protein
MADTLYGLDAMQDILDTEDGGSTLEEWGSGFDAMHGILEAFEQG